MKERKPIVLEQSTNTHITTSEAEVVQEIQDMTTMVLKTEGKVIVEHGHHNVVATDSDTKCVIKITQQEYNPVLEKMQNSFD